MPDRLTPTGTASSVRGNNQHLQSLVFRYTAHCSSVTWDYLFVSRCSHTHATPLHKHHNVRPKTYLRWKCRPIQKTVHKHKRRMYHEQQRPTYIISCASSLPPSLYLIPAPCSRGVCTVCNNNAYRADKEGATQKGLDCKRGGRRLSKFPFLSYSMAHGGLSSHSFLSSAFNIYKCWTPLHTRVCGGGGVFGVRRGGGSFCGLSPRNFRMLHT